LRFMGRKAECIQTANGRIETERYEPFVNSLPGIQKSALIGIGEGSLREPCLVVVLAKENKVDSRTTIKNIRSSLLEKFPEHNINRIFIQKNLPVDARHNAKIHRLTLGGKWTAKVSKNAKLGLIP
jgi:acyl-coenzyme A synthetase/AMP-(fatty) acid ligase